MLATDTQLDLEPLAGVAEHALSVERAWLGLDDGDHGRPPIAIDVCATKESLHSAERARGLPSSDVPNRTFAFRGGCYVEQRVILVPAEDEARMPAAVAHEVAHKVFSELVGGSHDAVDEGLASFAPSWLVDVPCADPELQRIEDAEMLEEADARALRAHPLSVRELLELGYWDFRADAVNRANFTRARELTRFLVQSREPEVQGRYRRFLDELRRSRAAWPAFERAYDADLVETRFDAWLERRMERSSVFGTWRGEDETVGIATGDSSAAFVWARAPALRRPWRVAFACSAEPAPGVGFGFTVGWKDAENFAYVELRPSKREVACHWRVEGAWARVTIEPLPAASRFEGRTVELAYDAVAKTELRVDGKAVAIVDLGPFASEGRLGLMTSQSDPATPARAKSSFAFRSIRVDF